MNYLKYENLDLIIFIFVRMLIHLKNVNTIFCFQINGKYNILFVNLVVKNIIMLL